MIKLKVTMSGYILFVLVLVTQNLVCLQGAHIKPESACQKLEISACSRLLNYTLTQRSPFSQESTYELARYLPLIRKYGFESGLLLHKLWCSMVAPPCQQDWLPPCRDVCLATLRVFRKKYRRALTKGEMSSISNSLNCGQLPTHHSIQTNELESETKICQLDFEGKLTFL